MSPRVFFSAEWSVVISPRTLEPGRNAPQLTAGVPPRRRTSMLNARLFALLVAFAALVACGSGDDDAQQTDYGVVLPFDTARVRLVRGTDTLALDVELAIKNDQHTLGLMERRHLGDNAG